MPETDESDRPLRTYYREVWRQAWSDTTALLRGHVVFAVLLLVADGIVGVAVNLVLSLAAIVIVCAGVLAVFAIRAPVELARGADARVSELEEQLGRTEDEPVLQPHLEELRLVAITLLETLKQGGQLVYIPADEPRPNLAHAFREHFPDLAEQLDRWTDLRQRRDAARDALRPWITARVQELGYQAYPYSGEIGTLIASEAEQAEPHLTFSMIAGHLQSGGYHVYTPSDAHDLTRSSVFDREGIERDLQQLLDEAVARPEHAAIVALNEELGYAGRELTVQLELVRDKHSIRTRRGCLLCR